MDCSNTEKGLIESEKTVSNKIGDEKTEAQPSDLPAH
jgi:hypothetical protein